jgi:adenylyl cyclase-associated protein
MLRVPRDKRQYGFKCQRAGNFTCSRRYLYKNDDCVVLLEGRLKALTVVSCKQTQISFHDLMAVVEVNNCTSVKVQSLGKCPAMTIDKTNGCQVYLSRASLDCNFVCAQSSEMNVNFPTGPENTEAAEEEEWVEQPIPEQFQHKIVLADNTLRSEVSDLYSH